MPLKPKPLISWWSVLIFCIFAFCFLFLLFPHRLLLKTILNDQRPSLLTITYLKDLVAKHPQNMDYKINLAKQEFHLGHYQTAQNMVNNYLKLPLSATEKAQLQILLYHIMRSKAFALKPHSKARGIAEDALKYDLLKLQNLSSLSPQEAAFLGDDALAINQPNLAISFYKKALEPCAVAHHIFQKGDKQACSELKDTFYAQAGKASLFVSDYQSSADFYLQAMHKSQTLVKKRLYFMQAITSLKAGNLSTSVTRHITDNLPALIKSQTTWERLSSDEKTMLIELITTALQVNAPLLAEKLVDSVPMPHDFDSNFYEIAYTVYLMNTHVQKAYGLAQAAVKQTHAHEDLNSLWRERLAKVAVWNQNPLLAAQEYLYLATQNPDSSALIKGIDLTSTIHDDHYLIRFLHIALQHNPASTEMATQMVQALLRLGYPEQALRFLKQQQKYLPLDIYLSNQIKIYSLVGDLKAALNALERYRHRLGINQNLALQESKIYIAQNKINKAWQILDLTQKSVTSLSMDFWQAYANMAWLTQHPDKERLAYLHLLHQQPVPETVYFRLIDLYGQINPQLAYHYAKQGKKAYPNNVSLAISAFSWCKQVNAWQDFPALDAKTPALVKKSLHFDSAYAQAHANYLQSLEQHEAALRTYFAALHELPHDPYIKSDFLFFLITTNDLRRLAQILPLWTPSSPLDEILWGSFAEGYALLNNNAMSLPILQLFYDHFDAYQHDPYWLISFKDILESTYHMAQSWAVTHMAFVDYLRLLQKQDMPADYNQLVDYIKLSLQEAPNETTQQALAMLQTFVNPTTELLSLTWAFDTKNDALADAIYLSYKLMGIVPPAWAVLTLALRHEDRQLMQNVLSDNSLKVSSTPKKITSYRDKIQSYQEIDDIAHAQQEAFESQTLHPTDNNLYDNYLTPLLLKTANKLSISQEFYQYSSAEGPRNIVSLTYHPTPSLTLMPYHSIWFSNQLQSKTTRIQNNVAISSQEIRNIPQYDDRVGAQIELAAHRGSWRLDVAHRHNLEAFQSAKLSRQYLLSHQLNTTLNLGYHQLADDSLGLLVGGMKNNVALSANQRLSSSNTLLSDFSYNALYTQSNDYVANNLHGTLNLEHRFNQAYPDFNMSLYASGGFYFHQVNTLSGSILTLIPEGVPPTANFLIPSSFYEYGITGAFGQTIIDDYTHMWRPFALLTISNNSNVGFGTLFDLGISGYVFGRDKLLLYYNQGSNQGTGIQIQRLAKISYSLYF